MKKHLLLTVLAATTFLISAHADEVDDYDTSQLSYMDAITLKSDKKRDKEAKTKEEKQKKQAFRWWCPVDKHWLGIDQQYCHSCRFPQRSAYVEDGNGNEAFPPGLSKLIYVPGNYAADLEPGPHRD